jgi:hypothetical protein
MKSLLFILFISPILLFSQAKPAAKTPAKPTTAAKPTPKANPAVVKLVEKAYTQYQESKDDECKKTIKQILTLDAKNKDAHLLLANLSMFEEQYEEMWLNLDKLFKFYPKEPEVYSQFVMTHLNYYAMPDSIKVLLCRKTIRLASHKSEPYATLGMMAAVSGYYEEALSYFDISLSKQWKDTLSKTIILLPYARCLYAIGDIEQALEKVEEMLPNVKGNDKYTCLFLKVKYKMDLKQLDVKVDLDTLNSFAKDNSEILKLNAEYYLLTNSLDTACKFAKDVRLAEGGETFDLSPYCLDVVQTLNLTKNPKFAYAFGDEELKINVTDYKYPNAMIFKWEKFFTRTNKEFGTKSIKNKALDSSYYQIIDFSQNSKGDLSETSTLWLSKAQFCELEQYKATKLSVNNAPLSIFRIIGNEQLDVLDNNGKEFLLNFILISDGKTLIGYLNDVNNPLIVKLESENINLFLIDVLNNK